MVTGEISKPPHEDAREAIELLQNEERQKRLWSDTEMSEPNHEPEQKNKNFND